MQRLRQRWQKFDHAAQHQFDCMGERVESFLSRWWGFLLYMLAWGVCVYWRWDGVDRYAYIAAGIIVPLFVGLSRRDAKAAHVQVERILKHFGIPDLDRLEERAESEIEKARGK